MANISMKLQMKNARGIILYEKKGPFQLDELLDVIREQKDDEVVEVSVYVSAYEGSQRLASMSPMVWRVTKADLGLAGGIGEVEEEEEDDPALTILLGMLPDDKRSQIEKFLPLLKKAKAGKSGGGLDIMAILPVLMANGAGQAS